MTGHVMPSTDDLVHNQRDGSQQPDLSTLKDMGFNDFERLILIARAGGGGSCLYACSCIRSVVEDTEAVIEDTYEGMACCLALTSLCSIWRSSVNGNHP